MKSAQRLDIDQRFLRAYRLLYADERIQTKREFCEKVGLLPQNFSIIERGNLSCTVDNIYLLSVNFGISLEWIFFGVGDFYKEGDDGHTSV